MTCLVLALTEPSIFTLTDFVKSLELGSTPVQTPPTQLPPTSSPIVPSLTFIIKLPPSVVTNWVVLYPAFKRLPLSISMVIFPPLAVTFLSVLALPNTILEFVLFKSILLPETKP